MISKLTVLTPVYNCVCMQKPFVTQSSISYNPFNHMVSLLLTLDLGCPSGLV